MLQKQSSQYCDILQIWSSFVHFLLENSDDQQNVNKQTKTSLDLTTLSNGIYFINVQSENGGVCVSKVVMSK
jgi:hypothetical protein